MRKTDAFRRAAALMAALSITVSLAAPAFAGTYYIDDGDITITKDENGQTVKQGNNEAVNIGADEEIIITTHKKTITSLESDLEGPAAEDTGFGPVVEENYQPEDDDQKKSTEESEDDDQKNAEESENDEEQKDADRQENTDRKESDEAQKDADQPENTDRQENAGQQAQPQQAAPAAAAASAPGFCDHIITVINKAATALKLTLKDVKIDVSDTGNYSADGKAALSVQGEGNVEIELDGDNVLKSGYDRAGLEKNSKGTLTLKDDKEAGSGSLKATGGYSGAGIGGGRNGSGKNITINGGTVNAAGGFNGAGIGGGNGGSGEDITIKGGRVTATGGEFGAGIGGGWKGSGECITIKDGRVTAAGGSCGSGIGGGAQGSGKNITINRGTVNATGGNGGSGIGGGFRGTDGGNQGNGENITINGGVVNAAGGTAGAGIGGGAAGNGSNVTVSGAAQVTATAGKGSRYAGAGATIGNGGNMTPGGEPADGEEIQADISGLMTTGCIHHIIYNPDGSLKLEWQDYGRRQPDPENPQPNPEDPNAPAEESNEVSLGTPLLHVETLEGDPLPFDARQQGSTLRVTTDNLAARLHGTRQALEALREQGVEQIQFVTTLKTTTLSVEDLLAEGGSWFALEHDGLASRRLSAAQAESLKCQMR